MNKFTDDQIREARYRLWRMGNLEWKLDPAQKDICDFIAKSKGKISVLNLSRRSGKSFVLTIMAVQQCIQQPKSIVKFLQPEQKMIRVNIKPIMDKILEDCPPEMRPTFKTQDNIYTFPNKSEIQLAGTDGGQHEKLRGSDAHLCLIDEAAFVNDNLQYIVRSILLPSTMLTRGKIILSSTSPKSAEHDFARYMERAEKSNTLIRKTIFDMLEDHKKLANPRLTPEIVEEMIQEYPGGINDEDFRRECLCLHPDTLIKTLDGYKEIKTIQPGDEVFTHQGRYRKVNHVFQNSVNSRPMYKVTTSNNVGFIASEDHQLLVTTVPHHKAIHTGITEWIKIKDIHLNKLQKHYIQVPIDYTYQQNSANERLAYLGGWYAAEGHCAKNEQRVVFSLANTDPVQKLDQYCQDLFNNNLKIGRKDKNCAQYALNSKSAKNIFKRFGTKSYNKQIPHYFKYASDLAKRAFLVGLLEGDGYICRQTKSLHITSTSLKLLADASEMFCSLGIGCQIQRVHKAGLCIIQGRQVQRRESYRLSVSGKNFEKWTGDTYNARYSTSFVANNHFYSRIKKIELIKYDCPLVYDMEVDEDHSYVGIHATYHNCETVIDSTRSIIPEFSNDLQQELITEWPRPAFCSKYVAMDIGFKDLTVVLFGYYDFDNGVTVVEDEIVINGPQMTTEILAKLIREKETALWTDSLTGEFDAPHLRISDNNLIVINDLYRLHGLQFMPAQKDNKEMQLNQVRMELSELKIIINPRCKTLISHLKYGMWNKARSSFMRGADNGHADAIDALIYLIRHVDKSKNPYPRGYRLNQMGPKANVFLRSSYKKSENNTYDQLKKIFLPKNNK